MDQPRVLFGKKIVPHHMLNFAEQVYDIMVGEIELGRWKVDERLPGVINLAKELGFGTKTIQTAYDRLKAEGYVRTLGYRGTYLKSTHPGSGKIPQKIVILVLPEQTADPLILWYEHIILQGARRRDMMTEVKVIPPGSGLDAVAARASLFGQECTGIISLAPLPTALRGDGPDGEVPLVFLVPPYEQCAPKISADVRTAYYELTCRLIRDGHRKILFSEDSVEPDPRQSALHLEGFLEAMAEHRLPVDRKSIEVSRGVANDNSGSVAGHLRAIMAAEAEKRPTAIVAGSLGRAMALVRHAPAEGVEIPRDLSVVSIGTDETAGQKIAGMLPDFDHMVDTCFGVLERQRSAGRSDYTSICMRMHFVPGQTLCAIAPALPLSENRGSRPSRSARRREKTGFR